MIQAVINSIINLQIGSLCISFGYILIENYWKNLVNNAAQYGLWDVNNRCGEQVQNSRAACTDWNKYKLRGWNVSTFEGCEWDMSLCDSKCEHGYIAVFVSVNIVFAIVHFDNI